MKKIYNHVISGGNIMLDLTFQIPMQNVINLFGVKERPRPMLITLDAMLLVVLLHLMVFHTSFWAKHSADVPTEFIDTLNIFIM